MIYDSGKLLRQVETEISSFKGLQRTLTLDEKRRTWVDQFDPRLAELSKELRLTIRGDFRREVENWLKSKNLDRMRNDFGLYETFSPDTILVPITVSGIQFGAETAAHLEKIHKKEFDFVLIGYPKTPEKCAYRGEGHMDLKKVYIQDIDTEFLRLNTGRPVFVLDDFLKEGTT